jgi:hypothetical protein
MADLDGDWDVDARDSEAARKLVGKRPGPSAFAGRSIAASLPAVPACAGGAALEGATLSLGTLGQPRGVRRFKLQGRLMLSPPLSPPLDPISRGFSVRVSDASGLLLLDESITGGDPSWERTDTGWFYNGDIATLSGVARVRIREVATAQGGFVELNVSGRASIPAETDPTLPLVAQVNLDPEAPVTLQCGESSFLVTPERPSCQGLLAATGTVIYCN